MAVLQRESLAPVLEHEPQPVRHQARPHAAIVGLDQRHHHPVRIRRGQIGGVPLPRCLARIDNRRDAIRPDQRGPLAGIVLRQQPVDGRLVERRVSVKPRPILERQPLGLDAVMDRCGRLEPHGLDIELAHHLQDLQRHKPLAVWRQSPHIHTAIVDRSGFHPLGPVGGQIGARHPAADALEVPLDPLRDLAFIERAPAALGDQAIGAAQLRVPEHLTLARRLAVWGPQRLEVVDLLNPGAWSREIAVRDAHIERRLLDDRRPRLTVADRGLEQVLPRQFSVALVQAPPRIDGPRHADRRGSMRRDPSLLGPGALGVQRQRLRAAARAIQAHDFPGLRIPQQGERIAANPAGDRLAKAQHRIGRNRRIHRRAPGFQHLDGGQRGQRVRGRRCAMQPPRRRTTGKGRPVDAVTLPDVWPIAVGVLRTRRGKRAPGDGGGRDGGEKRAAAHGVGFRNETRR